MKILFILEAFWEWLGIRCLSASVLAAGYGSDLLIENDINKISEYVKTSCPDIVGYLVVSGQHEFCISSAQSIKRVLPHTKIIFGGPHATFFPEIINEDPVDFICQGEGDNVLVELMRRLENGQSTTNIPGIWAKSEGVIYRNPPDKLIDDLDSLPMPDNELFEKYPIFRNSKSRVIMAGRGCPFDCSFCFNKKFKELYKNKSRYVRFKSPKKVIDEILCSKSKYPFEFVRFQDDTLISNKKWFLDFSSQYAKAVGLPYYSCVRADCIDEDIAKALKETGCYLVGFGLESGRADIRNRLLKKKISDDLIIYTANLLHKYKIPFVTTNMLALPDETLSDGIETIRFNQKIKTQIPWYSVFQPYPGTEIADMPPLRDLNLNLDEIGSDYHSNSIINTPDAVKLTKLHKLAFLATKFPLMLPIVKVLIKFPDNFLFKLIHRISHAWIYAQINRNGFWNTIVIGLKYEASRLKKSRKLIRNTKFII